MKALTPPVPREEDAEDEVVTTGKRERSSSPAVELSPPKKRPFDDAGGMSSLYCNKR